MTTSDLFADQLPEVPIGTQAFVFSGFALPDLDALLSAVEVVAQVASFRHMVTPGVVSPYPSLLTFMIPPEHPGS